MPNANAVAWSNISSSRVCHSDWHYSRFMAMLLCKAAAAKACDGMRHRRHTSEKKLQPVLAQGNCARSIGKKKRNDRAKSIGKKERNGRDAPRKEVQWFARPLCGLASARSGFAKAGLPSRPTPATPRLPKTQLLVVKTLAT